MFFRRCTVALLLVGCLGVLAVNAQDDEIMRLRNHAAELERVVESLRHDVAVHVQERDSHHNRAVELERVANEHYDRKVELERENSELLALKEKLEGVGGEAEQCNIRLREMEAAHENVSNQKLALSNELETVKTQTIPELESKLQTEVATCNEKVTQIEKMHQDSVQEKESLSSELSATKSKIPELEASFKSNLDSCQKESAAAKESEISKREEAEKKATEKFKKLEKQHSNAVSEKEKLSKDVKSKSKDYTDMKNKFYSTRQELSRTKDKLSMLQHEIDTTLVKVNVPLFQKYATNFYSDYVQPWAQPAIEKAQDFYITTAAPHIRLAVKIATAKYKEHGAPLVKQIEDKLEDQGILPMIRDVMKSAGKAMKPYHKKFVTMIRANAKVVLSYYKMNDYHPKAIAAVGYVYKYPSKIAMWIEVVTFSVITLLFIRMFLSILFGGVDDYEAQKQRPAPSKKHAAAPTPKKAPAQQNPPQSKQKKKNKKSGQTTNGNHKVKAF